MQQGSRNLCISMSREGGDAIVKVHVRRVCFMVGATHDARLRARGRHKWKVATKMVGMASPLHMLSEETRLRKKVAMARSKAKTTVSTLEELESLSYEEQGDETMNTDEALAIRARLRRHPDVVNKLQVWWDTAQRSMRIAHGNTYEASMLARDEYIKVMLLISKAMMDNFDLDEAQRCAEEDFEQDAQGQDTMSREQYMDALYELADVYTMTLEPEEYVQFLHRLLNDVATPGDDGLYFVFKKVSEIAYGGYGEEEDEESDACSASPGPSSRRSPATFDMIAISSLTAHPTVFETVYAPPTTPQTLLSLRATPSDDGAAKTHLDDDAILPWNQQGHVLKRKSTATQQKKKANVAYQSNGETSKDDTDHDQLEQADLFVPAGDPKAGLRGMNESSTGFIPHGAEAAPGEEGAAAATEAEAKAAAQAEAEAAAVAQAEAAAAEEAKLVAIKEEAREASRAAAAAPAATAVALEDAFANAVVRRNPKPRTPPLELKQLVTSLLKVLILGVEWLGAADAKAGKEGFFRELPPDPVVQPFADWAVGELSLGEGALQSSWGALAEEEKNPVAWLDASAPGALTDGTNKERLRYLMNLLSHRTTTLLAALPTKAKGRSSSYPEVAPELIAPNRLTKLFCDPPHPWAMVLEGSHSDRTLATEQAWAKAVRETNRRLDWLLSSYKHVVIEPRRGADSPATVSQRSMERTAILSGSASLARALDNTYGEDESSSAISSDPRQSPNVSGSSSWQEILSTIDSEERSRASVASAITDSTRSLVYSSSAIARAPEFMESDDGMLHLPNVLLRSARTDPRSLDMTGLDHALRLEDELVGKPPIVDGLRSSTSLPMIGRRSDHVKFPRFPKHGCQPYPGNAAKSQGALPTNHVLDSGSGLGGTSPRWGPTKQHTMLRKTPTLSRKPSMVKKLSSFQATETTAAAVPQGKMTLAEVSDTLQQLKWLQGIDARNLLMLSQKVYANQLQVPRLGRICLEGQFGDRMFILGRGAVTLTGTGTNAKHSCDVKAVTSFGESEAVSPGTRRMTAVALVPSVLLTLSHADLHNENPLPEPKRGHPRPVVSNEANAPAESNASLTDKDLGKEPVLKWFAHELHLMLLDNVVARLTNAGLFVPPKEKRPPKPSELLRAEFKAVSESVTQHASLVDYAQSAEVELLAPDGLAHVQRKFARRANGSMQIVSSSLDVHEPRAVLPADENVLMKQQKNLGDELTAEEFCAAGRVDLIEAASRRPKLRDYDDEERSFWRSDRYNAQLIQDLVADDEQRKRAKHLLGIRTRKQRLTMETLAQVKLRTDTAIKAFERRVDNHIQGLDSIHDMKRGLSVKERQDFARLQKLNHEVALNRQGATMQHFLDRIVNWRAYEYAHRSMNLVETVKIVESRRNSKEALLDWE